MTEPDDPADSLGPILADALRGTWAEMTKINSCHPKTNREWAIRVRNTWVGSLRAAFWDRYRNGTSASQQFAVFGGKPGPENKDCQYVISGIPRWGWEFLYDITVVELGHTRAPYNRVGTDVRPGTDVAFVKRAVWQVESEVAPDATQIAKDLSKLRVGAADHKLLVARRATQSNPQLWLDFIGRTAKDMAGDFFLGLMPTYASRQTNEAGMWRACEATITLYRCRLNDGSAPELISEIFA